MITATGKRSKFATDIMYRLWDEVRSCWVMYQGKTIWTSRKTPDRVRDKMIEEEGRNPDTIMVERVLVEVK